MIYVLVNQRVTSLEKEKKIKANVFLVRMKGVRYVLKKGAKFVLKVN